MVPGGSIQVSLGASPLSLAAASIENSARPPPHFSLPQYLVPQNQTTRSLVDFLRLVSFLLAHGCRILATIQTRPETNPHLEHCAAKEPEVRPCADWLDFSAVALVRRIHWESNLLWAVGTWREGLVIEIMLLRPEPRPG